MELLYVWIEDYNNIKQQGFNFSPKHKFEFKPTDFDEKGNVIGGTLTHDDINTNYPDNFFGEHISNITAIVGKNGSGKSSLVRAILDKGKIVIVLKLDKENHLYSNGISVKSSLKEIEEIGNDWIAYYSTSFNSNITVDILSSKFIDISTEYLLANSKSDKDIKEDTFLNGNQSLSFRNAEKTRQVRMLRMFVDLGYNFMPDEFKLNFGLNRFDVPVDYSYDDKFVFNDIYEGNIAADIEKSLLIGLIKKRFYGVRPKYSEDELRSIYAELSYIIDEGGGVSEMLRHMLKNIKSELPGGFYLHWAGEFLKFCNEYYEYNSKKDKAVVVFQTSDFIKFDNSVEFFLSTELADLLSINLTWRNMSDGEVELLGLFSRLAPHLNSSSKIFFLDEPDVRMHPEWQREIVNKLKWFFNEVCPDFNHHLILTTHSPFLVSDLPRENIIFLENGDDDLCKVKEPKDMDRTFGANIHNLYRSSFFMQDGLMGAFAKGKIDGVIKDLNGGFDTVEEESKETRKKEMDYIIGQIGEPVIQGMLRKKYNDKFHSNGSLNERILKLEEELAYLKMKSNDSN